MEFFEVIEKRSTIRKYSMEKPPLEDLKKIINAARLAPSAQNRQSWHYVVIYNKDTILNVKNAIANKYDELASYPEASDIKEKLQRSKAYSTFMDKAPVLIACFTQISTTPIEQLLKQRGLPTDEIFQSRPCPDLQSISGGIANISNAAEALGYGTCWMTAPIVASKEIEVLFSLDKDYKLIALLTLGKPHSSVKKVRKEKKALEEIMTVIV